MPLPDSDDAELLDALRLNLVSGVGPRLRHLLRNRFGSIAAIFHAGAGELQTVPGVGPKLAQAIRDGADPSAAERELRRCREQRFELILRGSPRYPAPLEDVNDAPDALYCRGELEPRDAVAVAIVGSRHCTLYGRQQAEKLAAGLSQAGVTIVSGLARGIDSAAHRGALQAGGRTLAVMATGLASVYPPEHAGLAEEIAASGAVLSEFPLDQQPIPGLFPLRNRIISGLSLGVAIVEAGRRSGALHTARHAMEQGREVFAVPGRIDSPASDACHDLIRDGATLVRGVDDILSELGPLTQPVPVAAGGELHVPRELALSDQEREILGLVTLEPQHLDEIVRGANIEPSRTLSTITVLEMKRLIQRLPGGYLVRRAGS